MSSIMIPAGFPGVSVVKNPPVNAGTEGHTGSIPGSGRSPGGGYGNCFDIYLLEKSYGQRKLAGYSPGGCKESDTAEQLCTKMHK